MVAEVKVIHKHAHTQQCIPSSVMAVVSVYCMEYTTIHTSTTIVGSVYSTTGLPYYQQQEDNTFVGAGPKYWECPQNWKMKDGVPAKTAPCGSDRAIFEEVFHSPLSLTEVTCPASHRVTTTTLWSPMPLLCLSSTSEYEENWLPLNL